MIIKFADVWERNHIRVANSLAVLALVLYVSLRYAHFAYEGHGHRIMVLFGIVSVMMAAMLLCILFVKTTDQLAILMPSSLAMGLFLSAIFNEGAPYVYMSFVGVCAVCGTYFSIRPFVKFVLGLNAAIFVSKILGIELMGPGISTSVSNAMWVMLILCNIVIFIMVRYMASRYRLSKRSMGSYHAMLASTPNLVALVDKENRIYHISDKLAELASVQRLDMVLGRPILDVFDNPDMIEMIAEALDVGAPYENTATIRLGGQDQNHIHYKITCTPMNVAVGDLVFIDIADITPIMDARYEAESASRAKSDFLSKMSHEIRTPLNGIMGMTEVMSYENIAAKTRDQLETIKHSGNHLLSIINNLLDFSKIEHGKLEVVPKYYLFHSLINDVISIITMQMKSTNLRLTVYVSRNIPQELYGDVVRIRQILLNILSNAVKYTHEGYVAVEVMGVKTGEDAIDIAFKVTDTGIGLKQEEIDRLYEEFTQFNIERHHGIEGTGLGLAITYSLVKIMKGWIDVKSVYGQGSTFTVTLPQKFRKYDTITPVIDRENKNVLIYGIAEVYADSITRPLSDFGVRHYTAQSDTELYYKLSEKIWNFVFVCPELAESVNEMCGRLGLERYPGIVIVRDWNSIGSKDSGYATLTMPVYGLSILNILNYAQNTGSYPDAATKTVMASFTAPDARVLVVDDIPTNLKVAQGLLSIYEMQVDTCTSGLDALAAIKNTSYDLIMMDHMMPGMDGIATLEAIRGLGQQYADMPIAALTANTIVGTMEMLLAKGFDDFLSKPIDVTKLNIMLERWIPPKKQVQTCMVEDDNNIAASRMFDPEIEGVDVAKGMSMSGGDLQTYLEILSVFCEDIVQKTEEIKSCLAAGDLKLYTIHVHALKVALANIGAMGLSKHAQALENAGHNEDMVYILGSSNEFIQGLEKLLTNIPVFLQTRATKPPAESAMSNEDINKYLTILKTALQNFDLVTIDETSAALRSTATADVDAILKKMLIGDYDRAIDEIDKILMHMAVKTFLTTK